MTMGISQVDELHGTTESKSPRVANLKRLVIAVLAVLLILTVSYPIIWVLLSSIKGPTEFNLRPIYALPEGFYWQNYVDAWTVGKMALYFRNSAIVTIPSLALVLALGVSAAFGIEVMRWRLRNSVLLLFLSGIFIPMQAILLPLFTIYFHLKLLNNLLGLVLVYVAAGLPLTVFLMTGYLKAMPREVLEAAVMDGASIYQIFYRIAVPVVRNSILTVGLVQFFFMWNDLLFSLTFNSDIELRTIQSGLLNFVGRYGQIEWGPTFAGVAMTVIPMLLIYVLLNEQVMKGLTSGAVKG
jgi:raffinose/stachyose/melibiose transport system permease protein